MKKFERILLSTLWILIMIFSVFVLSKKPPKFKPEVVAESFENNYQVYWSTYEKDK